MEATRTMDIGLCWSLFRGTGPAALIELAARHGFPTITLGADMVLDAIAGGAGAAGLRRHLSDAGVRVSAIDGLGAALPGMDAAPVRIGDVEIRRPDEASCWRAAQAVGAPMVSATLHGARPVPGAELIDGIAAAAGRAAAQGLSIAFEFIPATPVPDIAAVRDLVRDCGAVNLTILLDPWHLARSGGTAADVAALPPGSIGVFQLCDRIEPPPGTPYVPMAGRLLPGEGELPLHAIAAAALANSPGISAELEIFSEELSGMPTDGAAARIAAAVRQWRTKSW